MGKSYDSSIFKLQEITPPGLEITEIPSCLPVVALKFSVQLSVPPSQILEFWTYLGIKLCLLYTIRQLGIVWNCPLFRGWHLENELGIRGKGVSFSPNFSP